MLLLVALCGPSLGSWQNSQGEDDIDSRGCQFVSRGPRALYRGLEEVEEDLEEDWEGDWEEEGEEDWWINDLLSYDYSWS